MLFGAEGDSLFLRLSHHQYFGIGNELPTPQSVLSIYLILLLQLHIMPPKRKGKTKKAMKASSSAPLEKQSKKATTHSQVPETLA